MNILCVIPARGGSKGIPGKNLIQLNGKPLIAYTIEAAVQCKDIIHRIIVTTDSQKIAEVSETYGAEIPFLRDGALATDEAHTIDVVKDVLDKLFVSNNYKPDWVLLLQPTSPFRDKKDIEDAIKLAKQNKYTSVISVKRIEPSRIAKTMKVEKDLLQPAFSSLFPEKVRRQDGAGNFYEVNGSIYLTKTEVIKDSGFFGSAPAPIVMSERKSIDIDEMDDLLYAEYLIGNNSEIEK